jgi:hypothetical protein
MYNQTQLIMISKELFPEKNIFNLTSNEQAQVIEEYEKYN